MKKIIAVISALIISISCMGLPVFASSPQENAFITGNLALLYSQALNWYSEHYPDVNIASFDYVFFHNEGADNYGVYFFQTDAANYHDPRFVTKNDSTKFGVSKDYVTAHGATSSVYCYYQYAQGPQTLRYDGSFELYPLVYITSPSDIVSASIPIFDGDEKIYDPKPTAIPNPYTITYNPNLSLNMERETDLMSIDSVDVNVHLNHDFIDWYIHRAYEAALNSVGDDGGFSDSNEMSVSEILETTDHIDLVNCGRSDSLFFITSADVNSALYDCTYSSVYTYLADQRYSIVDKQSGLIDGSTSTAVYANGYYPYFDIVFTQLSKFSTLTQADYDLLSSTDICYTFTVDLRQINWPGIMEARNANGLDNIDFPLECVLTSNLRYFPSGSYDYNNAFNEAYGFSKNGYDSTTGETDTNFGNLFDTFETESSYYDYFINEGIKDSPWYIYTRDFSFTDSLPDYVPLKDIDGNDIDLSGNPGNHAKNPPKPHSYQSVDMDGNLSKERTEQEQLDYDESFKLADNFGTTDFTDFGSLFSTSGSYFEFLTSCLKILPSWFLAIFTAFFTLLLALALIKFILD